MPDICVTCGLALPSGLSDRGLSLAHESSVMPDICVTCGLALPSGLSDRGLSLAHKSSVLPDIRVTCGLALPRGLSDGGLSPAHESSVMSDICVTCGLALPSGLSGVGVVVPVRRSKRSCARYFPRNSVRLIRAVHAVVVDQHQSHLIKQQDVIRNARMFRR